MDEKAAQEILDELVPSLEALDTQSTAVLQFLKSKKLASEEELAPFFEQAANASNVRWRAVRLRIDRLVSSAIQAEQAAKQRRTEQRKAEEEVPEKSDKNQDDQKSREPSRRAQENLSESIQENHEPTRKPSSGEGRKTESEMKSPPQAIEASSIAEKPKS
jgi:hypothetical protein